MGGSVDGWVIKDGSINCYWKVQIVLIVMSNYFDNDEWNTVFHRFFVLLSGVFFYVIGE